MGETVFLRACMTSPLKGRAAAQALEAAAAAAMLAGTPAAASPCPWLSAPAD